ncbi:unnamed protein product [Peronospora farinosa]|nr:unnamed protein product [Peronospora farinosa]
MRDRGQDRWGYESGYCERTRERELSSRSLSLVRTSSFASDYFRESEASVSAEEGEEKSEENYMATSERSLESQTPSESGSINWEMTNATESGTKRMVVSSTLALPPRPTADSSWNSGVFKESDGHSCPTNRKAIVKERLSRRSEGEKSDVSQVESAASCTGSIEVDDEDEKKRKDDMLYAGCTNAIASENEQTHVKRMSKELASAAEVQIANFTDATTFVSEQVQGDEGLLKKTTEVPKTDDGGMSNASKSFGEAKDDAGLTARTEVKATAPLGLPDAAEVPNKVILLQEDCVKSSDKYVLAEDKVEISRENLSSVSQQSSTSPGLKHGVDSKMDDPTTVDPIAPHDEGLLLETKEHRKNELLVDKFADDDFLVVIKDGGADRGAVSSSSSKAKDADQLSSWKPIVHAADVEMTGVDADDGKRSGLDAVSSVAADQQVLDTDDLSIVSATKPKDTMMSENREVEEREAMAVVTDCSFTKLSTTVAYDSLSDIRDSKIVTSLSSSLEQGQGAKRAVNATMMNTLPDIEHGRKKRAKVERSRTDPSSAAFSNNSKPRSTSFSSFGLQNSSRCDESAHEEDKGLFRAELTLMLRPAHEETRESYYKQRDVASSLTHKHSPKFSGRPAVDRRASFSTLPEHSCYASSEESGDAGGSRTSRSSYSKPFLQPYVCLESSAEGRRRDFHDGIKKEDVVKREVLPTESVSSIIDAQLLPVGERILGAENLPAEDKWSSKVREELPSLPNIPLPRGGIRATSSPTVVGEGTPTKRHRPRLGWGQGLVAPSSPPQPAKRPRIGWGQGLVQQKNDTLQSATTAFLDEGDTCVSDGNAKSEETSALSRDDEYPPVKAEAGKIVIIDDFYQDAVKKLTLERSTPEKAKLVAAEGSFVLVTSEAETGDDAKTVKGGAIGKDSVVYAKPLKEEVLAAIDILDSDIAGVKKQIEALQRRIACAEESACVSADTELVLADEPVRTAASSKLGGPTDTSSAQPLLTSPVKLAVDPKFVELLAGVFSENLRKTTAANDRLPKRMEKGQVATKIYHQPSDYPFYQDNIDRGSALSNQMRLKVRMRNRARHEYLKKLARDYVDMKKSWKVGVKKMEKDRKRQEKLRLKQLQKEKLKTMSESGPVRTTNTIHQSPHVQQLVAAEKAAEAAGEGTIVRTSSRLTNNSSADLDNNDLEKIEQAKTQALIDQEVRKKRLKNALSTAIPDMLITAEDRQQRYFTRFANCQSCMADGLVTDWKLKERAEMKVNPWNDLEKCIYVDKFLQFPKNFPQISLFLSNKTTGDVIAFYYRTKKVADYKALLREQQLRRRGAGSKNTWSCWNLSACAAICLGVQFPEHVAKLLLHPSNFRSHQASDNILNSAGAQRLLRGSKAKVEGNRKTTNSNAVSSSGAVVAAAAAEGLSALDLVSRTNHTSSVRSSVEVQLDNVINSGDSDTSDEEKFTLYTQQLEQFIAGQQRPFLLDYASLLTDNSYSTGYEVSTHSVEERLKKYPTPSKELESAIDAVAEMSSAGASEEATKSKQQSLAAGSQGNLKNCCTHTMKESKQHRKMKKTQEGDATLTGATITLASSQAVGGAGGEKSGSHNRKKNAASSSSAPGTPGSNRGPPRISIPEEKAGQSVKKLSRSGGGTPGVRRTNSSQSHLTNASPKSSAVSAGTSDLSTTALTGGTVKKVSGGSITPHANARTSSPSANAAAGGNNANAAVPAKRVVQKWTEGEKADFLKFFSQYGKDWTTLTENIPTKTAAQIKNYYQNYKNRLNLQDILKRRIENAVVGGCVDGKGVSHIVPTSAATSGTIVASPRSAAAGLMSGTLRQMGRSVELPGGLSVGMPDGSMAMSASDVSMSFQAALSAAQPGMHGVNGLSELSTNQFVMQAHQDQQQQQQSRETMNPASNSERYLKLLNMQHQLQIMQFQQQQKSQGMASECGGAESNNSYHESKMQTVNAQRLYQFSRQQQHQVPPQHLSMQALQQMGLQAQFQNPVHTRMIPLPMQQQQMGHQSALYQPIGHLQAQHPQVIAAGVQMNLSSTSTQHTSAAVDGGSGLIRGNAGSSSGVIGHHDAVQRSMMNIAIMKNGAGGNGSAMLQGAVSSSPCQPMVPSRSMAMETSRPQDMESRQPAWHSALSSTPTNAAASAGFTSEDTLATASTTQDNALNGRDDFAPPHVQPVCSRMSFSSILNESESPRDDFTPRGNGSMVIRKQESPRMSEQQCRQQQGQLQRDQQQQLMQQRHQPPLHLEHARAIPPSAELSRSPVSAPSPTAHLLPRRSSVPTPHNRMGLMSSLLNVPSPERRTSTPGHQSPLIHQQQRMQRQTQPARYYDASRADSAGIASRSAIASIVSGMPSSSTMSSTMARTNSSEIMTSSASNMDSTYSNNTSAVALSRSGSASSTSSVVSNAPPQGDLRAQQQMWNYAPQIRFEEAELLRRAQRAEEEAARAAAAAAAAARALQEAQQARQQALDMAANMARYNSAMQQQQQTQQQQAQQQQAQQQQAQHQQAQHQQAQQQQAQQQQAQQQQAQQQQAQQQQAQQQQAQQQQAQQQQAQQQQAQQQQAQQQQAQQQQAQQQQIQQQAQQQAQQQQAHQQQQYQQLQQYQFQGHHHQQMHQQQQQHHDYQQQHQAQQLHQHQMQQHQALHHHLQLMQQQQQRSTASPSDRILQQQQQPPQRGPQADR